MRVLMLHDCAGVALTLRQQLLKRGFNVDLYYFHPRGDPYHDYRLHLIQKTGKQLALFVFKKILEKYDLVHTYNTRFPNHPLPYDFVLAKAQHKKVVVHFHGSDLRLHHGRMSARILLKNKTLLVSTPDLLRYCPPRAIWLPNPVSPEMFHPAPQEPHDSFRILHSSTDFKLKGTTHLIKSVDELKMKGYDVELLIVGESNPVPACDMPKYYNWADVVVNEITVGIHSLVGIEAMMCNRLVVSSCKPVPCIESPPIINIDPTTLTDTLESIILSPKKYAEMAKKGRKWAIQHHSPEKVGEMLVKIYEEA